MRYAGIRFRPRRTADMNMPVRDKPTSEALPRGRDNLLYAEDASPPPRMRRSWRAKFHAAFRGIKLGVRGHSSFSIHFFFTAMVVAAAIVLRCDPLEWCILLGCIGLVLIAELFNSAIETLFRALDETTQSHAWPALDIAAGAVLLASITAAIIGSIVFLRQLSALFGD
jgi:diacylglycerol kinase